MKCSAVLMKPHGSSASALCLEYYPKPTVSTFIRLTIYTVKKELS